MKLNNMQVFSLTKAVDVTGMEDKLRDFEFTQCRDERFTSHGWSEVCEGDLIHLIDGVPWLKMTKETKIIPAQVVNDELNSLILKFEKAENRKLRKAEKQELKEQTVQRLLPRAFSKITEVYGFIMLGEIFIFTSSSADAELFLNLLRQSIGSLPVIPLMLDMPSEHFKKWLSDLPPKGVALSDNAVLAGNDGEKVTIKNDDLSSAEMKEHLESGKTPTQLGLRCGGFVFKLDDRFNFKSLNPDNDDLKDILTDADSAELDRLTMKFMQDKVPRLVSALREAMTE